MFLENVDSWRFEYYTFALCEIYEVIVYLFDANSMVVQFE